MTKQDHILNVALELLSQKEKLTPQGEKAYITAGEVYVLTTEDVNPQDVVLTLVANFKREVTTKTIGNDIIKTIRFTL